MSESQIETIELERLVDGELSDDAYRELVDRLDRTSDGWRRCALMFLEQQMLQQELPAVMAELASSVQEDNAVSVVRPAADESNGGYSPLWLSAIVAACLVGFLAGGIIFPGTDVTGDPPAGNASTVVAQAPVTTVEGQQDVSTPGGSGREQAPHTAPNRNAPSPMMERSNQTPVVPPVAMERTQTLRPTFVNNGTFDDQGRALLPAYALGHEDPSYSAARLKLEEKLSKLGNRVRRRWSFRPVELDDGTQVVIPIEHIDVRPTWDNRLAH